MPSEATQSLTVRSAPELASEPPSGEKATAQRESVCPSSLAFSSPEATSQSLTSLSLPPVASRAPSREKATPAEPEASRARARKVRTDLVVRARLALCVVVRNRFAQLGGRAKPAASPQQRLDRPFGAGNVPTPHPPAAGQLASSASSLSASPVRTSNTPNFVTLFRIFLAVKGPNS